MRIASEEVESNQVWSIQNLMSAVTDKLCGPVPSGPWEISGESSLRPLLRRLGLRVIILSGSDGEPYSYGPR